MIFRKDEVRRALAALKPLAPDDAEQPAAVARDVRQPTSPPGRPRRYDWDAFLCQVALLANDLDGLPETQAELERDMAAWCLDQWGTEPGESTIRRKIAPIYQQMKKGP